MMPTLKVGDEVRHKAGRHKMVVAQLLKPGPGVLCEWHDDHGVPQSQRYHPDTLELWSDYVRREEEEYRQAKESSHYHDD